ncbi:hypothetical protein [Thalassolituus oleivorans]|uniref:hypothetical protein n=1 Tax=Thalassolituus oleivorans TaxID=187493 RepID=UPI00042DBB26|nr:hypothetical protein [Thalassolituus oleivorans]AHK17748.1 hypothetical protein R615_13050 [Thalassolituus oleivorans R6-15]
MRLRSKTLSTSDQLAEFDQWLTAKLERIKDSDKFRSEIDSISYCIESIASYLNNFSDYRLCSVENLCKAVIAASESMVIGDSFEEDEKRISHFYESFFNLMFLTSGATDNNLKNHFLIRLKDNDVKPLAPKKGTSKKIIKFTLNEIPSTTKSDYVSKFLASCLVGDHKEYCEKVITEPTFNLRMYLILFLNEYVSLVLEEQDETMQFWAICHSYVSLNESSKGQHLGKYLLNSCTIFKVRGSVSASGGHVTENILRQKLTSMGLRPNTDFNINDVTIGNEEVVENGKRKKKTRAYDFILPYRIANWEPKPKLFIQSQFYAGDSGSVSHKVVDQTNSSRAFTLDKYKNARFVEYLDGAGYYAALRGDLEHMLSLNSTASFFQVKSILVRLRRELQLINFLTPIEFEHAILTSNTALSVDVFGALESDGYPQEEIQRAVALCIEFGYVLEDNGKLTISSERIDIARRLLVLDIAANNASIISDKEKSSSKYLLVPGYGSNYGILDSHLSTLVCNECKQLVISVPEFSSDIEWLLDQGVFKRR